jgi:hypothetical protein
MREVVMPGFTERVLSQQEPTIQFYTSLLVSKIKDQVASGALAQTQAIIDVVQ